MNEYHNMLRRQLKYLLYLLSIFTLGWGFTSYKSVFAGLILGTVVSVFNLWLAHRKIDKFGQAVASGKKARSLGMFLRMASAAIAVAVALSYPDIFHLISLIIGIMTSYMVIMIDFLILSLRRSQKRGEDDGT